MSLPEGVGKGLLPRMPGAGWEGWFLIAIPRRGSAVRFVKTHFFCSKKRAFLTPLGALEGLTAQGEILTYAATGSRIYEFKKNFRPGDERAEHGRFHLELPGDLRWEGEGGRFDLRREAEGLSLDLHAAAQDKVTWIEAAPVLSYFGLHSKLSGAISLGGVKHRLEGMAVQEHAWGALVPFNPSRLVSGRWHWDVLAVENWNGERDVSGHTGFAGLSVHLPLAGERGLRARGRVPRVGLESFTKFEVQGLAWAEVENGFEGRPSRYPTGWRGRFAGRSGELSYEAHASTPLAPAAPGGGFLGFDFEGTWKGSTGSPAKVSGSGFAECGGPS